MRLRDNGLTLKDKRMNDLPMVNVLIKSRVRQCLLYIGHAEPQKGPGNPQSSNCVYNVAII